MAMTFKRVLKVVTSRYISNSRLQYTKLYKTIFNTFGGG